MVRTQPFDVNGDDSTAYPVPPWTMCSLVPGRDLSQAGGAAPEVERLPSCPTQSSPDWRNSPLPTRWVSATPIRCVQSFFFLMTRRPPRSTLFPYPTLSQVRDRQQPLRLPAL